MTPEEMATALDAEFANQGITVEDLPTDTIPQDWYQEFMVDVANVSATDYDATVAAVNSVTFAAGNAPGIVSALIAAAPAGITHYGHTSGAIRDTVSTTNARGVTRRRQQSVVFHAYGW